MAGVIDSDTHVVESEQMWEFFDEAMKPRRPTLVAFADPATGITGNRWVIDGKLFPRPFGRGGAFLATPPMNEQQAVDMEWSSRSLNDPAARVAAMESLGIQSQVIFPTLFIAYLTDEVDLEVALCRAYNRYMADACSHAPDRLRWIAVPPLRSIAESIGELNFARENGAAGILMRGLEGDRSLAEPYFHPIYAEASRLGLPVCIHIGGGSPTLNEMADTRYMFNFASQRLLPVIAFHDLLSARIPEQFPDLRIGFIEATASWVPFVLHFLQRRLNMGVVSQEKLGPALFRDYRMFVACEADEDIPYLLTHIGEDNLLIGTDYGHHGARRGPADQSVELDLVSVIGAREDVPPSVVNKMLRENPRHFYALT
ncbi:MAG TPA: amidohydrolase family protein [Dehalococcoidia bacterium]|nr:amidohydrolase family protein [Dehalococcoidia bacterium]